MRTREEIEQGAELQHIADPRHIMRTYEWEREVLKIELLLDLRDQNERITMLLERIHEATKPFDASGLETIETRRGMP